VRDLGSVRLRGARWRSLDHSNDLSEKPRYAGRFRRRDITGGIVARPPIVVSGRHPCQGL